MAVAGSITYRTELDTSGFEKGLNNIKGDTSSAFSQIRNIVASLGITDLISSAFNTLTSFIDSAMNRIDTMDQFTRVMTAMTGSAEEADKALGSIKDTVTGTAYGLDIASKSAQKFVTSGMNLDEATRQVKTWADAVAFYGDGTNATFENVTDALSQMVAKGKVEMDQLSRLTDAGIPAVQIYADSVGRSVAEVQDDLSYGRISAQEFMEGLSTAFNEGTNKFASITDAAKEAGASWSATFDNAKAAATRGMQSIIESIDEALDSNSLPTMREMISDVGSMAEDALKEISKRIPDILNLVKKLLPLVEGIGISFISWKAGNILQSTTKNIKGLLSSITGLSTGTGKLTSTFGNFFNILKSNPFGAVLTGISLISSAISFLVENSNSSTKAIHAETAEIQKQVDARIDLQETIAKQIGEQAAELTYYQNLYNELKTITDENGRVKAGYEDRAAFITSTLSDAMDLEISLVDGAIENYQQLTSTFDDVIAKKKGMIILNAQEEAYTEAIKSQASAQEQLGEVSERLAENQKAINKAEQEYQDIINNMSDDPLEQKQLMMDKSAEINNLKTQNKALEEQFDTATELYERYAYDIASYEENMSKFQQGKYDEMVYQTYAYVQKKKEADDSELKNLQFQLKSQQQVLETLKSLKEKYNTDIYDNQITSAEQQIQVLQDNINKQGQVIDNSNQILAEKWNASIQSQLNTITGRQFEFREAGNGLVQTYIDGVAVGQPFAEEKMQTFANNMISKLSKKSNAKKSAEDIVEGVTEGLENKSKQKNAVKATNKFADSLIEHFNSRLDINSPSGVFAEWSEYIPEGVAKGVDDNTKAAVKAIDDMDKEIVNKMKHAVAVETGNINAQAKVSSAVTNHSVIQINATFDGNVELDKNKVGRIITPVVTKTIKVGGIR